MKIFDIYGKHFQLHIGGDYSINSGIGGFMTIVTSILMIIYIYLTGSDIFFRSDPYTYQENQTLNASHALNFTNSEFRFYFNLFYGANRSSFVDPTYLKIKLTSKFRKDNYTIKKNFDLKQCITENFKDVKQGDDESLILKRLVEKNYYCPNFTNFTLSGSWVEGQIEIGQIQVYPCNNNTDNVICKSPEKINDFVLNNKIYISIYYPLSVVRLGDYQNPIIYDLKEDYYYIRDLNRYNFYYYAFDKISLTTDSGILFNSESIQEGVSMKLISNDARIINDDDPCVFSIDFYSSFNLVKYKRYYIKILDIISAFGGMLQILTLFFHTILSVFHNLQTVQSMTDKLFIFEDPFKKKNSFDDNLIMEKIKNLQEKMKETESFGNHKKLTNKNQIINNYAEKLEKNKKIKYNNKNKKQNFIRDFFANKDRSFITQIITNNMLEPSNLCLINKEKDFLPVQSRQAIELNDLNVSRNIGSNNININSEIPKISLINEENYENKNTDFKLFQLDNTQKTDFDCLELSKNKLIKTEFENNMKELIVDDSINIQNNISIIDSSLLKESERQNLKSQDAKDEIHKISNKLISDKIELNEGLKNKLSDNNEVTINYPLNNKTIEVISDTNQLKDDSETKKKLCLIKKLLKNKKSDSLILNFSQQLKFVFKCCINFKKIDNKTEKNLLFLMNEIDEKIESYFDFLNIIKVIEETNLLKHILMTSQQKLLMELLRKEHICIHDKEQTNEISSIKFLKKKNINNNIDDDKIIEAVSNLFYFNQRDFLNKKSNNSLKINKHFIEILEEKIQL